jgi:RimJ/RimL family protein N-acetyltransferase
VKTHTIKTERLLLRRWQADDVAPFAEICADPDVMRWIGKGETRTPEQCAAAVERFEHDWSDHGFGLFAVELRETGRFIGFIGLSIPEFLPELLPAIEIGWRLARNQWGRGLATEGAKAALRFGLEDRHLDRIVSIHQIGNGASERIMEKLGLRLERETVDPTCNRLVRVYEILRSSQGRRG